MNIILAKLIDESLSAVFEKIKSGVINSKYYTNLSSSIKTDFSNSEICKIVKLAFDSIKNYDYYNDIENDELQLLIQDNSELIYSWVISDEQFHPEFLSLQNDENKKKHISFMESIYHYIRINRINYIAISNERIISKVDNINIQTNNIREKLDEISTNINWTFSSELNSIENKIKDNQCNFAVSQLEALENKILQANNKSEIEKFYQLYTEVFLVNSETQQKCLPYLQKLINFTEDDFLKWYRIVLYNLISKNFDDVNDFLNKKNVSEITNHKQKQLYYEIKINYLMLTQKNDELESFLKSLKNEIDDYINWILSLYVSQGRYEEAVKIINEKGTDKIRNKTLISQAKTFYYITRIQTEGHSADILNVFPDLLEEIESLINKTNDDFSSKKALLILKGIILQNINKIEEAYITFKKVEDYGYCNDPNYLRYFSLVLMLKQDFENALSMSKRALELMSDDLLSLEVYFTVLTELYPEQAIKELENFNETEETLDIKLKTIKALINQERVKTAHQKLLELEKRYPDNSEIIFQKAEFDYLERKYKDALENYIKVFENNPNQMVKLNAVKRIFNIGINLRESNILTKALSLITEINYEYLLVMGYEIIQSLILLDRIKEAHLLVKKMEDYQIITNPILRLDMNCYFASKNYEQVIIIYNKLKKTEKLKQNDLKIYLLSLFYLGKRNELLEAIDIIPDPTKPIEYIFQSQTIRNVGVFQKALAIARDGYNSFPDNIQIMENFIRLILSRGPEEIDEDTLNDFYKCRDNYFSLSDTSKTIKSIPIPLNADGNEILKILEENLPHTEKFNYFDFLNNNHLHISILSKQYNYFFLWKNVLELPQYKIFISDCSITDLQNQYKRISKDDLVIDLPSLITCAYLNILPHVAHYFKNVYISVDSISVLERAKSSQFDTFGEDCTSGLYQLNNYTYPNFQINYSDLLEYLKRIDDFRNNNNVHTVGMQLEPKQQMPEELKSFLDKSEILESNDIKYAQTSNIQLMLESAVYRIILKDFTPNLNCFEIESLLYKLLMDKKIPISRYFEAIYKLIKANYYCIYFNHTFLTYYFKKSNYSDSDETNFLQQLLISDAYLKDWVALLITNLIIHTILLNNQDISAITFVLKWITKILKERKDFSYNDRFSFFYSLYTEMPIENIKQIILQIWEEEGKDINNI